MYSQAALKIYAAKKNGIIKSNTHFWRQFCNNCGILPPQSDLEAYENELKKSGISLICAMDEGFPCLPDNIRLYEKPYLFAYMGDISLLSERKKNTAVVGVLTPTEDIVVREKDIVGALTRKGLNIISGLANGCDCVAHKHCLDLGGKTVAFLPTPLDGIYPQTNAPLAQQIVRGGGLVITEYITPPANRYELIKRFIERDRLQAMFAANVVLIASYDKGQGDSGSRHAMQKAAEYGAARYVMYNHFTDSDRPIFALNKRLAKDGAKILTPKAIDLHNRL